MYFELSVSHRRDKNILKQITHTLHLTCSILATGGFYEGRQLLSTEVIQQLSTQVTNGTCVITGLPLRYGRGVQIFKNPLVCTLWICSLELSTLFLNSSSCGLS